MGGTIGHCYGHTYSEPLTRLAFQRALASVSRSPGTMVYGNTTIYGPEPVENFANLAGYLVEGFCRSANPPSILPSTKSVRRKIT